MIVSVNRNSNLIKAGGNTPASSSRKKVHNIHIVDCSGSMAGNKYNSAIQGINEEVKTLKGTDDGVDYTMTIIEFDSGYRNAMNRPNIKNRNVINWDTQGGANIMQHVFMIPLKDMDTLVGVGTNGGTPLYQTVGEVLEKIISLIKQDEAALITVLTDGQENASTGKFIDFKNGYNRKPSKVFNDLIDLAKEKHNITVTFSGTVNDVDYMVANAHLSRGNTMSHDNTGETITAMYSARSASLSSFSKSYSAGGASVSESFFSDNNTNNEATPVKKTKKVTLKKEDKVK